MGKAEPPADDSRGYEALAAEFMRRRSPGIGVAAVRSWASELPPGGTVLDLGCGHGVPISQTLVEEGLRVYAVDASPSLVAAFRERVPLASVACEPVEHSRLFERTFDGVIAWGLLFLLEPDTQVELIHRAASALVPGGRLLFTSPAQVCSWPDRLTGRPSVSLGGNVYRTTLAAAGLSLVGEWDDEGGNHYYDAIVR